MQLTVLLLCLVLSLSALEARPWSPSVPMQPSLYQLYKHQKQQRNLAKIQPMPRNAISFVGPRQATTSLEADDADDDYYDDDYEIGNGIAAPVEYTESEEDDDDYGWR